MAPYESKTKNGEFLFSGIRQPSSSSNLQSPSSSDDDWRSNETPKFSSHRGKSKAVAAAYSPDINYSFRNGHYGNNNDTNPGDWNSTKTAKYSSHRGNSKTIAAAASLDDDNSIQNDQYDNNDTKRRERTRLKDVFSCARPGRYANNDGGANGELQAMKNVEVFLDGLVNGFWQCPGFDGGSSCTVNTSTGKSRRPTCKDAMDALAESTQLMEFKFVRTNNSNNNNKSKQRSRELGIAQSLSFSNAQQPKKATGKVFKRVRVKRGENIGLELFENSKNVYISKVAKEEGIDLKRGMRIIAINDHPCPDSVGETIELLARRMPNENGYVTFVTAEDHDFEAAASVVSGGVSVDDNYSTQSSVDFV